VDASLSEGELYGKMRSRNPIYNRRIDRLTIVWSCSSRFV
jgi:hypothetical protein